ncbi:MAG TPA: NADPH-dependent FMN reductase [Sphingomonas sp.]|nr:NADPH-dependent FMN reductase [Sphingomonas sp.]
MAAIRVLAVSGSLRSGSYNTALLKCAAEMAPADMIVDVYDELGRVPPYDDDVRAVGYPPIVQRLRERVHAADALIIATPEYNRSFSGVLKNAIDWVSRPPDQPFAGKPALVTGAAAGALGTIAANYQLRQVLSVLGVHVLPGLEFVINHAGEKFDGDGILVHQPTRDMLATRLADLMRLAAALAGRKSD